MQKIKIDIRDAISVKNLERRFNYINYKRDIKFMENCRKYKYNR